MILRLALNLGFEHTDEFLSALPSGVIVWWRMFFAELVNNKESGGPGLSLDHWAENRGEKYPGLEEKTTKTRSQILINPFALLFALPFEFSLAGERLALLREQLRVVEGRRLCLYTWYNAKHNKGEYRIALVPQSTQRGDLICGLNGDSRHFAFREVAADRGGVVDDGSTVCNLVGMSCIENLYNDYKGLRTRLVLQ
jgi:hypothetical protein